MVAKILHTFIYNIATVIRLCLRLFFFFLKKEVLFLKFRFLVSIQKILFVVSKKRIVLQIVCMCVGLIENDFYRNRFSKGKLDFFTPFSALKLSVFHTDLPKTGCRRFQDYVWNKRANLDSIQSEGRPKIGLTGSFSYPPLRSWAY